MSNESVINTITFKTKWKPDDDFYKLALKRLFENISSNGRDSDNKDVIGDHSFEFFWNEYPASRVSMIHDLCYSYSNSEVSWRETRYTKEFSQLKLLEISKIIDESEESYDLQEKLRIVATLSMDYDFLKACYKYSLDPEKEGVYNAYSKYALNHSKDPELFDFLFSKIKRAPGSVKQKTYIIERAIENDALSPKLLGICAKRGTKNMKRTATGFLSSKMSDLKHSLRRYKRNEEAWQDEISDVEKNIDVLEDKLMLFVDCDDATVVQNLMESLSKDNLPWLMPAASKHYYLNSRLQRMIDSDNEYY